MPRTTDKYLSYLLRHAPDDLALQVDEKGWTSVYDLVIKINEQRDPDFTERKLRDIVKACPKQRFELSAGYGSMIRAAQGHSIAVDLDLPAVVPPILFHGTTHETWDIVAYDGLRKMTRNHVHLSYDYETALKVGKRHGKDVAVLGIAALRMHNNGGEFYESANGVWLTDFVSPAYIMLLTL